MQVFRTTMTSWLEARNACPQCKISKASLTTEQALFCGLVDVVTLSACPAHLATRPEQWTELRQEALDTRATWSPEDLATYDRTYKSYWDGVRASFFWTFWEYRHGATGH